MPCKNFGSEALDDHLEDLKDAVATHDEHILSTNQQLLDLQARLAEVDEKLGASLNNRMLGALEAAVVPLAETMTKQMVELETRVCRSD